MDTEVFDLCKKVSERFPKWRGTDCVWYSNAGEVHDKRSVWHKDDVFDKPANVPLYTSDYLLGKLPGHIKLTNEWAAGGWRAIFAPEGNMYSREGSKVVASDTPLKALLKLVIALDDAGELK